MKNTHDLHLTKEKMIKLGYKDPTDDEAYIFNRTSDQELEIILDAAERFSEIEADELELDRHSDSYRIIQKANRGRLVSLVVDQIKSMKPGETYVFTPATDYQMKMVIKERYAEKLPQKEAQALK